MVWSRLICIVYVRWESIFNLALALFNLIPLFPLDGSHMLRTMLPQKYEPQLEQFERFAPFVLLGLIITGIHWIILSPILTFSYSILMG